MTSDPTLSACPKVQAVAQGGAGIAFSKPPQFLLLPQTLVLRSPPLLFREPRQISLTCCLGTNTTKLANSPLIQAMKALTQCYPIMHANAKKRVTSAISSPLPLPNQLSRQGQDPSTTACCANGLAVSAGLAFDPCAPIFGISAFWRLRIAVLPCQAGFPYAILHSAAT